MNKTLFENGLVITVDDQDTVYRKGYLLVEGDRIAAVGEGDYAGDRAGVTVVDADGKAVLPGIVDAHTHVAGSLFKGLLEDDPNGFYGFALPMEGQLTPEDVYHLSRLGAWECMQAGVTTVNEIYHYVLSVAKAVDEVGLRAVISQNIVDVDIGALRYNDYTRYPAKGEAFVEDNIRLIEEYHGKDNGRITCRFGPHATDTVSMELAKKCVELGKKYGVGFHTHVAQSEREVALLQEAYGLTPVEFLRETGLLGDHLMAAHCIYTCLLYTSPMRVGQRHQARARQTVLIEMGEKRLCMPGGVARVDHQAAAVAAHIAQHGPVAGLVGVHIPDAAGKMMKHLFRSFPISGV